MSGRSFHREKSAEVSAVQIASAVTGLKEANYLIIFSPGFLNVNSKEIKEIISFGLLEKSTSEFKKDSEVDLLT